MVEARHHLLQKHTVLATLVQRTRNVSDSRSLRGVLDNLKTTFLQKDYSANAVAWVLNRPVSKRKWDATVKPEGLANFPFHSAISGKMPVGEVWD